MMMAERQIKILNMIQEDGSVQVEELAKELVVSPMTIRRDLEKLRKEGLIERCHGGAVSKTEVAYADKSVKNHGQKVRIAEKCEEFIREGTTVYLDAGTTTYEIAKRIMDKENMTVITNDLEIALLMKNSKAELILCGGYVQKSTGSTLGYYTTQMIEDFRFDTGFFGAAAISGEFHVLTPTTDKAFLKRQLVKQCQQAFLAVDDSKFNRQGMNRINCLADYTGIITDHEFKEQEKAVLRKKGVRIISVNQENSQD
ncbi:DeoR/GlpR family DNA-binding transcription regulator [Lacrimispora celerecrescens]|uniref:DeoR family transcriptional regulator n=1 Tax=[Clostridium] celerecrescens 18A TaxID=1286362 RepID=A0A2M8ZCB7_9FIRM|nr:DeoR/GlpR family DNA-binding transcription regulator [Lacrimispora celerecrescens]PJJ31087.1 DeoR family transcriptional regulator [[Clostridium] celerecrescens 18A]